MRTSLIVLASLIAFTVTATGVMADDLVIPWWRHGKDPDPETNRSTFQQWEFGDDADADIPPEAGYVSPPPGPSESDPPSAAISAPASWTAGVWSLSGGANMALFIPNYSDGPEKKIWIQLTWKPAEENAEPAFSLIAFDPPTLVEQSVVAEQSLGDGWVHSTYMILVQPNPQHETINISGEIYIDEVVVDTICPEPATMVLLGLAVPCVLLKRRRRT